MDGYSQTAIITYLNEVLNQSDSAVMSHQASPGNAIANFLCENMGDMSEEKYKEFGTIFVKAITANTYLFTRTIEACQKKQVQQ